MKSDHPCQIIGAYRHYGIANNHQGKQMCYKIYLPNGQLMVYGAPNQKAVWLAKLLAEETDSKY